MATFSTQFTTTIEEYNASFGGSGGNGIIRTLAANEYAFVLFFIGRGGFTPQLRIVTPNIPNSTGGLTTATHIYTGQIGDNGITNMSVTPGTVQNSFGVNMFTSDPDTSTTAFEQIAVLPGSSFEFVNGSAGTNAYKLVLAVMQ